MPHDLSQYEPLPEHERPIGYGRAAALGALTKGIPGALVGAALPALFRSAGRGIKPLMERASWTHVPLMSATVAAGAAIPGALMGLSQEQPRREDAKRLLRWLRKKPSDAPVSLGGLPHQELPAGYRPTGYGASTVASALGGAAGSALATSLLGRQLKIKPWAQVGMAAGNAALWGSAGLLQELAARQRASQLVAARRRYHEGEKTAFSARDILDKIPYRARGALIGGAATGLPTALLSYLSQKKINKGLRPEERSVSPAMAALIPGLVSGMSGAIAGHGVGHLYGQITADRAANTFLRNPSEEAFRHFHRIHRTATGKPPQFRIRGAQFSADSFEEFMRRMREAGGSATGQGPRQSPLQGQLSKAWDPARHGGLGKAWSNAVEHEVVQHGIAPQSLKDMQWFMQNVGRVTNNADVQRLHIIANTTAPQDSHLRTIMQQVFHRHHGETGAAARAGELVKWGLWKQASETLAGYEKTAAAFPVVSRTGFLAQAARSGALRGGLIGAGLGGLHGALTPQGYDPATGQPQSRLQSALGGGLRGGLAGGAIGGLVGAGRGGAELFRAREQAIENLAPAMAARAARVAPAAPSGLAALEQRLGPASSGAQYSLRSRAVDPGALAAHAMPAHLAQNEAALARIEHGLRPEVRRPTTNEALLGVRAQNARAARYTQQTGGPAQSLAAVQPSPVPRAFQQRAEPMPTQLQAALLGLRGQDVRAARYSQQMGGSARSLAEVQPTAVPPFVVPSQYRVRQEPGPSQYRIAA